MKDDKFKNSFWYFKPEGTLEFGKYYGKTVNTILAEDPSYLNYCIKDLNHFMFSCPVLLQLRSNNQEYSFTNEALESLGRKMDISDTLLLNYNKKNYENNSKTGSVFKSIHSKGVNNISSIEEFFKFIDFKKNDNIIQKNKMWFNNFYSTVTQVNNSKVKSVSCTAFLINHGLKNVWVHWLKQNWGKSHNRKGMYSMCLNILNGKVGTSLILTVDTHNSFYSPNNTRITYDYDHKRQRRENVILPERNEHLFPSVDFWRFALSHLEGKKSNWIFEVLSKNLKERELINLESVMDGKSIKSFNLALGTCFSFKINDKYLRMLSENYYNEVLKSNFLEIANRARDFARTVDQLGEPDDD